MTQAERALVANASYAARFDLEALSPRPRRRLAVVTCMDTRLDVLALLGLEVGDAHIIRNAGGIVTDDVIRSLCLSQRALGTTAVLLVHHTGCGVEGISDQALAAELEAETGQAPTWSAGGFSDAFEDVRRSLRMLAESPFLSHRHDIGGFVYDVTTGSLAKVD